MNDQTQRVLALFVEKSDLLENRNFVKYVSEHGISYTLKMSVGQPVETQLTVPDDEALAALMVTFRMFIQDNDAISFRNLGKLMDDAGLSENWKAQVNEVRQIVNEQLDRPPAVAIDYLGIRPTAREILNVFVYGDIAHTSETKRSQFLEWKQNPLLFQLFQHSFHAILMMLLDAINYIAQMTKLELAGAPVPRLLTPEERTVQENEASARALSQRG